MPEGNRMTRLLICPTLCIFDCMASARCEANQRSQVFPVEPDMPLILPAIVCSTLLSGSHGTFPDGTGQTDDESVLFTGDGAWCWFQDPRAVFIRGAHAKTYGSWMTSTGRLQIGAFDHADKSVVIFTLKERWDVDDHNTASILVLPDKRLMVFYARHNKRGLYCRSTVRPEDITAWEDEVVILDAPRLTYSHPVYLKGEETFYVFFRGETWKPTYCTSQDGRTWISPQILIQDEDRDARDVRPYMKVISDGESTIHFAFTDGHPRNEALNSVYYLKYKDEAFFRADGRRVAGMEDLPIPHSTCDHVYNAARTGARAWVWDIALDHEGHPCIAYTRLPAEEDHRYHYARWTEHAWLDTEIAPGGRWFPQTPEGGKEPEPHYSGGMALAHQNPSVLYISRQSKNGFTIERWRTADGGRTWSSSRLASARQGLNVRPLVPFGYTGSADFVLWMTGQYVHFSNYHTAIRMIAPARP